MTSIEALDRRASPSTGTRVWHLEDSRKLLESVTRYENLSLKADLSDEPDPTWGWYVFLTDYIPATKESVDRAMQNLLRIHRRSLGAGAELPDVYADEAYLRLKLELVEDREALEGASYDRVRECFRALARGLNLCDNEDDYPPAQRYHFCLVLEGDKIEMLADLPFHDDDEDGVQDASTPDGETCKLLIISLGWQRPEMSWDSYRGVRDIAIHMLPRIYELLKDEALEDVEEYIEQYGR